MKLFESLFFKTDLPMEIAIRTFFLIFCFQLLFLEFLFELEVFFLGTAIINSVLKYSFDIVEIFVFIVFIKLF